MKYIFYCPNSFEAWDWRSPDDPGIGGSETAVVELSSRLARRGHDVLVYAKTPTDATDNGYVEWRHVDTANLAEPGVWIICRCPSAIDRFEPRPDQVLYHQCQDVTYFDGMGGGAITKERSAKIAGWIALCPDHQKNLETLYPFLRGKIILSSNGIKSDAIEALPFETRDPFRLIWTSSPDRGLETTLKVFNRAREFEPRLSLHIFYGWDNIDKCIAEHGEDSSWGREKRKMLALSGPGVHWRGRMGQRYLWREYLRSGIWLYCTAFTETSCISCMEAQALGAIPICSPVWALRTNVKYGVSIPGDNNSPLTQARFLSNLLRLVRDHDLAESIREPMMKWARFHFDWEHVVDGYEALIPAEGPVLLANKPIGTVAYLGGLPCILEEFAWSWGQMIQFNSEALCEPGQYVHYERSRASFHAFARNNLADIMQGDWLLMLDTDHTFEPDLCVRLLDRLNAYDADVVVGIYQHKSPPFSPVLYLANEQGYYCPIGAWGPANGEALDVFAVDSCGAGCMMIRRRVFDRIRAELGESPFDVIPPFGEDHSFAKRLGKLGIKILCDPRIEANHLRVQPVTMADYDRSAVRLSEPRTVEAHRLVEAN